MPRASDPVYRRWLAVALVTACLVATGVAAFNIWIDPFQYFHLATRFPPRFYTSYHRFINPGLARNGIYDVVVSGSSIVENTRNNVTAEACGGTSVNLAMPAMSASEQRLILDLALRSRRVRRVVTVLDFNEFAGSPDSRQEVAGPLPRYLYDDNPFNDFPYVLSWDVFRKSLAIYRGVTDSEFRSDTNAPWFWAYRRQFGRSQVLRELNINDINARFQQPPRTFDGMRVSFDRNVLSLMTSYPDTRFEVVWPPYSILVWLDFAQRDQLEVTLAFKRYVAAAVESLPNVRIHDLQAIREVTHDLDRYTDIYHFDPSVNDWIVRMACGSTGDDLASLARSEAALRAQVQAVARRDGINALAQGRFAPPPENP